VRRQPFEGRCRCEDCDLEMEWDSAQWSLLDGRLHCSPCTIRDIKKDCFVHGKTVVKFHKSTRTKSLSKVKKNRARSGLRAAQ